MPKFSNNPEYNREREFAVILEDLRSQFRVFGEQQKSLARQLATKADKSDLIDKADKSDVQGIQSSMDRFLGTLSDHETRITRLETHR